MRRDILNALLRRQNLRPHIFRLREDRGHELTDLILRHAGFGGSLLRRRRRGGLLRALAAAVQHLSAADQHTRIDPERPADQSYDDDRPEAEMPRAKSARQREAA